MSRALNTGDSNDAVFSTTTPGILKAGWKQYTSATATTAPTFGYNATEISIDFNVALSMAFNLSVSVASLIVSTYVLMY